MIKVLRLFLLAVSFVCVSSCVLASDVEGLNERQALLRTDAVLEEVGQEAFKVVFPLNRWVVGGTAVTIGLLVPGATQASGLVFASLSSMGAPLPDEGTVGTGFMVAYFIGSEVIPRSAQIANVLIRQGRAGKLRLCHFELSKEGIVKGVTALGSTATDAFLKSMLVKWTYDGADVTQKWRLDDWGEFMMASYLGSEIFRSLQTANDAYFQFTNPLHPLTLSQGQLLDMALENVRQTGLSNLSNMGPDRQAELFLIYGNIPNILTKLQETYEDHGPHDGNGQKKWIDFTNAILQQQMQIIPATHEDLNEFHFAAGRERVSNLIWYVVSSGGDYAYFKLACAYVGIGGDDSLTDEVLSVLFSTLKNYMLSGGGRRLKNMALSRFSEDSRIGWRRRLGVGVVSTAIGGNTLMYLMGFGRDALKQAFGWDSWGLQLLGMTPTVLNGWIDSTYYTNKGLQAITSYLFAHGGNLENRAHIVLEEHWNAGFAVLAAKRPDQKREALETLRLSQ